MALTTLNSVLEYAEKTKTAIPSFNVDTIPGIEATLKACEDENCPVILTVGQFCIKEGRLKTLAAVVRTLAESSTVPVVLHLDHSRSYEQICQAINAGFTSVMYDGSHGPFEQNIVESKNVIRTAHAVGVSVECELGAIGGVEDDLKEDRPNLCDLDEVRRFIGEVSCDALAVGIGNAHGIYKSTPNLDFDRLRACQAMHTPPLVLHGGSGIPDEMIKTAIEIGIRKINVATEMRIAFMAGLRTDNETTDFYRLLNNAKDAEYELARHKVRLFQRKPAL